jgi:hypothetical protein
MRKTKLFSTLIKIPKQDKNRRNRQQKKKMQQFSTRFGRTSKK